MTDKERFKKELERHRNNEDDTIVIGGYRIDRHEYNIHIAIAKRCIAIDSYIREHPNYPDDITKTQVTL